MRHLAKSKPLPNAVLRRISLYHCVLTDMLLGGKRGNITSKELAGALGVSEATLRSDLTFVGEDLGIRGVGYKIDRLRNLLGRFLALPQFAPIAFVGPSQVVNALFGFLNVERSGFVAGAFFSEDPNDEGVAINGIDVLPLSAIPSTLGATNMKVAVIATRGAWAQQAVDLLAEAGVKGILVMTSVLNLNAPEGVTVSQFRFSCDIKGLFHHASSGAVELDDCEDTAI